MSERDNRGAVHGGRGQARRDQRTKRQLLQLADDQEQTGTWLAKAMEQSWGVAEGLLAYPVLPLLFFYSSAWFRTALFERALDVALNVCGRGASQLIARRR